MSLIQCSVITETTFRCSGIAQANGKCEKCNTKEELIRTEEKRLIQLKKYENERQIKTENERLRIKELIKIHRVK